MSTVIRIPESLPLSRDWRIQSYVAGMISGLSATLAFSLSLHAFRILQLTMVNPALFLGTLLQPEINKETWLLGLCLLYCSGALLGLLYALAFQALKKTGFQTGAAIGFAQWIVAGILLGFLPEANPAFSEEFVPPGFFALSEKLPGFSSFFLAHILFGAVLGEAYSFGVRKK